MKIPSSVNTIGYSAFGDCKVLVEAILTASSITEIPKWVFASCRSLQTVSLPNSLQRIGDEAFSGCKRLVTVIVPLDSKPIKIGGRSFRGCKALANLVLPKGSNARGQFVYNSFEACTLLQDRFGRLARKIVAGLIGRFDNFPVHKLCYHHSSTTAQKLRLCIKDQDEMEPPVDDFGMSPVHILCSTAEASKELMEVLLDEYPDYVLGWKTAKDKLATDYLVSNWTPANKTLLQMALQSWMYSRLERWGATSWMEAMQSKVQAILVEEHDKKRRSTLWMEACSTFAQYENVEALSILEMALWKREIEYESSNNGGGQALDREECRCVCGSNVVILNVVQFLDIVGSDQT
eukprot:CAMPEP_0113642254 /NCGR_PEP_ID=MMETSP0017_2-20120614/22196_1 /TAXON_ID=2856 /ORGANISM="Cylindrotheca closterium" /LENGTH=348 /DNA_ID=CAMNT_0000553665 /DNA_START=345 /DNA_END=1391 /DNA_ORIENTATION=+ /assembly_acc=CAM_ASM_000147